ncbi:PD-(D/E)XK nuclease family protein [Yanshouia hominis]|uniref:PD-(D/E)XK nuclease family protein n=1 Tax=Yanshouia hominis TaxID=2763673 RepID=A0ABR7NHV6_9FIRM|nr:PD-(D/E)XK nuclease family protein [Yanshouia hominis]MBC8575992.1 PD-(D/E)XK nuclease family protein [Yanshouia hominis]
MLHLVCGAAHSGKTALMQQILLDSAQNGRKAMLIVPEQASFSNERMLYSLPGGRSELLKVLSFTRLSELLLRQLGGLGRELIGETASAFLVNVALEELSDTLTVYRRHYRSRGFIGQIAGMIRECQNAGVSPGALSSFALAQPEGSLRQKAYELSVIYDTYEAVLHRSYLSPTDLLTLAADRLAADQSGLYAGEEVVIDDFGSFTAPELRLIEALLGRAHRVSVALCCDAPSSREPAFALAADTAARLAALAREQCCGVEETLLPGGASAPGLAAFERAVRRERLPEDGRRYREIRARRAADPYEELSFTAAEIARLVREEGLRYREIAVIARDLSRYDVALPAVFERYRIPCFLDLRTDACSSALTQGVLTAAAVAGGLREGDPLQLAASPLTGLSAGELGALENYCYVWSVRGRGWEQPFVNHPDGMVGPLDEAAAQRLAGIEDSRRRVMEAVLPLRAAMKEGTPRRFAEGIWRFLQDCGARERLEDFAAPMPPEERRLFLEEQNLLWEQLVGTLDLFAAMPEEITLDAERAYELLELAVGSFEVATVPRTLDEVAVGTADRMRPENPRVVFLLGLVEGEFPSAAMPGGLFSEEERERMARGGLPFIVEGDRSAATERMFCYRAATAATERLYAFYPAANAVGERLAPSELFTRAAALSAPWEEEPLWEAQTPASIETALAGCGSPGPGEGPQAAALRSAARRVLGEERCRRLEAAAEKQSHKIGDGALARRLFGMRMRLSPTRLEQFYRCPFSYYMNKGLGAKARQRAELSPAQAGTLIHRVLEQSVAHFGGEGLSTVPEPELRGEIARQTDGYLIERLGDLSQAPRRLVGGFRRIGDWLYELLRRIGEELSQSRFEPAAFELSIREGGEVEPLVLRTAGGGEILVEGTVDRVDVAEINGRRYLRVLDYKSGRKKFLLDDVYYGLNLQMLVYLFTICKNGREELSGLLPAGALYLPALGGYVPAARDADPEKIAGARLEQYRMNGLLLDDPSVLRAMEADLGGLYIPYTDGKKAEALYSLSEMGRLSRLVEDRLRGMAEELHRGEIAARPSCRGTESPCGYCDYRGICGFEEGDPVRELAALDRDAVLKELQEEAEQ